MYKAQIMSYLIKDVGTKVFAYSILDRTIVSFKDTITEVELKNNPNTLSRKYV